MATKATARRLRDAVRHLVVSHGTLNEVQRPCGAELSVSHAYALLELLHQQQLSVSQLASKLAIDRTNVSRLCARMEEAGDVVRSRHPDDGRVQAFRLTAKGKRVARAVDEESSVHFDRLVKRLGGSVGEVVAALDRLTSAMAHTKEAD